MQLWFTAQLEGSTSRSFATNLSYLQILLLLAIEAGNRAPSVARGQAALSQSVWHGSAVGLAYEMKLHELKVPLTDDLDSDERVGRRIWWSLVIMDRWHASSISTPLLISDDALVLMPEDQSLLGESSYHLTRKSIHGLVNIYTDILGLSIILGHYTAVPIASAEIPSLVVPASRIFGTLLRGELERWREVLPDSLLSNSPLIHLCYWYLRITLEVIQADTEPSSLLTPATKIVELLTHNPNLISPLNQYFSALATFTLMQLTDYDKTRVAAEGYLKTLVENRIAPSPWDSTIRDMMSAKKQTSITILQGSEHASTAAQGLQHLAELATADEEGRDVSMGESRGEGENFVSKSAGTHNQLPQDLRTVVREGMLRVLSGDSGR
jgi:hypothetical protein